MSPRWNEPGTTREQISRHVNVSRVDTDPDYDYQTVAPPPSSSRGRLSRNGFPVSDTPPPSVPEPEKSHPAEKFGKRYAWITGVILGIFGIFGAGYTVSERSATVSAAGIAPLIDRLDKLDTRTQNIELTMRGLQKDVEWLKLTMAASSVTSNQLNVQDHNTKAGKAP